jgi:hypothetical protein
MIIIASAILFAFGLLLLLVQAIRIAFSLVMIAYYLIKIAVCLTIATVLASVLFCQWLVRLTRSQVLTRPEPVITIDFYSDEVDVPTIELPREHFRRGCGAD